MIKIKKSFSLFLKAFLLIHIENTTYTQETWINVYIHGIMSIAPHLTFGNFIRFMNDSVIHTLYAKQVELIRNDPFFSFGQAMQQLGLHQLYPTDLEIGKAGNAIAAISNAIDTDLGNNNNNYYYTFGWTGLLSPKQRYYDAHELFVSLTELVNNFEAENKIKPKIRIIGYSHGGNVSLNLAAVRRTLYPDSPLIIDEQVLIGVPLVTETDFLVADKIFKKTYHIFSPHDRIQQIDLFSFSRLFSRKIFKNRHNFKIPDNLFQIQIKIMKPRGKDSPKRKQLRQNMSNPAIVSGSHHLLSNVSPGHIELWFFGWTPQHYRPHFILNPLPLVVFLPYIINSLRSCEPFINQQEIIIFDIRPEDEIAIIKQYQDKMYFKKFRFFDKKRLSNFATMGLKTKPESYSNKNFKEHIKNACKKAARYYRLKLRPLKLHDRYPEREVRMRQTQLKPFEYK